MGPETATSPLYVAMQNVFMKMKPGALAVPLLQRGASDGAFLRGKGMLLMTGKPIFTLPRIAVYRGTIMNHLIHHRAQLVVYLRLNNVPVPGLYGPSADEQAFG